MAKKDECSCGCGCSCRSRFWWGLLYGLLLAAAIKCLLGAWCCGHMGKMMCPMGKMVQSETK